MHYKRDNLKAHSGLLPPPIATTQSHPHSIAFFTPSVATATVGSPCTSNTAATAPTFEQVDEY